MCVNWIDEADLMHRTQEATEHNRTGGTDRVLRMVASRSALLQAEMTGAVRNETGREWAQIALVRF